MYTELCNSMFPDSFNPSLMHPTLDQICLFLYNRDITAIQIWMFLTSSTGLYLLPHPCLHNPTQHCYALDTSTLCDTDHKSVKIGLKLNDWWHMLGMSLYRIGPSWTYRVGFSVPGPIWNQGKNGIGR